MGGWLCIFRQHKWRWLFNAERPERRTYYEPERVGVYQCTCCKELSIGSVRWRNWKSEADFGYPEAELLGPERSR